MNISYSIFKLGTTKSAIFLAFHDASDGALKRSATVAAPGQGLFALCGKHCLFGGKVGNFLALEMSKLSFFSNAY